MSQKITVLMSVYNGEKYLRQAIDSILNQTFKDFEFLIINDGSTDSSVSIIKSYSDPRIRLIHNKKNIGLTRSLNKGLRLAKGAFIARIDADDVSLKERLKKQYEVLKMNSDIGLVGSWVRIINKKGEEIDNWKFNYNSEKIYYLLNFRNYLAHSSVMFRRELIQSLGGYNEAYKYTQDFELWNRISKVTKIYLVKKILVCIRNTSQSLFYKFYEQEKENSYQIVKNNLTQVLERELSLREINSLRLRKLSQPKELETILKLFNEFDSKLLKKESKAIDKIGLNLEKVKRTMIRRKMGIVKGYLRQNYDPRKLPLFFKYSFDYLFFWL